MTTDRDAIKLDRESLKKKYGTLFNDVSAVLFEADPIGINFNENTDEYEPEVGTILPRLTPSCTVQDVERIVHEEFCRWFCIEDAGPIQKYRKIAVSIWELWRDFKLPQA